jgi:hypothetical protein
LACKLGKKRQSTAAKKRRRDSETPFAPRENSYDPQTFFPDHAPFAERDLGALQVEVGHLRKYVAELEHQARSSTLVGKARKSLQQFSFLTHLPLAKFIHGKPEQQGVWKVSIGEAVSEALYLQPPAELSFEVPTAAAGELCTAVSLHPDVWKKAEAGACEFHLRVDGKLAFVVAIDPVNVPGHRAWHDIQLTIPENSSRTTHQIVFETRSVGPTADFRWALWRAPRFVWEG